MMWLTCIHYGNKEMSWYVIMNVGVFFYKVFTKQMNFTAQEHTALTKIQYGTGNKLGGHLEEIVSNFSPFSAEGEV